MFEIKIAQRLKPFSHTPGVTCLLPGTPITLQVFPTLLRMVDDKQVNDIPIDLEAPCLDFTVVQDLEKASVVIFGKTMAGDFRYRMNGTLPTRQLSRLSLGQSKQLDWDLVARRKDLREILPVWYALGQLLPVAEDTEFGGSLLGECAGAIAERRVSEVADRFMHLFLTGFRGMLTPYSQDGTLRGFPIAPLPSGVAPHLLLSEGAKWIERLFVQCHGDEVELLPVLPHEFDAGRMLHVPCGQGTVDLEWRSRKIRRAIFKGFEELPRIILPKNVKDCRIRSTDKGHFFDRFE